jgi:hypothetical protein
MTVIKALSSTSPTKISLGLEEEKRPQKLRGLQGQTLLSDFDLQASVLPASLESIQISK